ncbi:MAG: hypothetical protein BWY23_02170 [Spirochaetes bacterium ADurb.Bin218]|nr:MAG: hypothetical protein BWY23_02170 [Spirochaetes bacterium ADurb.Bin218]
MFFRAASLNLTLMAISSSPSRTVVAFAPSKDALMAVATS